MERPKSLQNFIQSSGVQIQRSSPPTFPRRLQNSMINNQNMGEFAQFVYNSNSNENINVPVRKLSISGLNPGMFNATINDGFGAEPRIDLKHILQSKPLARTSIGEGLFIDTTEILGIYGRFKTGFSHTKEYGKKGNINEKFFTAQIKFKITNGTETTGGTANFYKNGKIRFSSGFIGKGKDMERQPELIRRFMVKKYTRGEMFLYNPFVYNNLSAQFRINGVFSNLAQLHDRSIRYGFQSNYEPELSPMMYVKYKDYKYILAKSGAIQISGAKNPVHLNAAYNAATDFFSMLLSKGEIKLTTNVPNAMSKRTVAVKPKASSCPKQRRPPCKSGFQVKKNPQGDECCYKIPKKRTTRASPRNKVEVTYDADGTMRIGKKKCTVLTKATLLDVARKMGVVGAKDTNKKDKLCSMIKNIDLGNTSFKVGNKPCVSYKKEELIALAMNKGISVNDTDTIKVLCEKLKLKQNNITRNLKQKQKNQNKMTRNLNKAIREELNVLKVEKRRRLNKNSIKNDIIKLYGSKWMRKFGNVMNINRDVNDLSNKLNTASNNKRLTNKNGILKKMNADSIKKETVKSWKNARIKNYKEAAVIKKYGKYGDEVVRYVIAQSPSEEKIKKFIIKFKNERKKLELEYSKNK